MIILLIDCSEVNEILICVSRSRFSCIMIVKHSYSKNFLFEKKKVTITGISDCFGFFKKWSVSALFMLLLTSNNNSWTG